MFLTAVGVLTSSSVVAQQPAASPLLEVRKMTPKSPKKLKFEDRLTLEVRYQNPGKGPVSLMIRPSVMTSDTTWSIIGGKNLAKASGKEELSFHPDNPTSISEIEVMMLDAAGKKITSVMVPVQFAWEEPARKR